MSRDTYMSLLREADPRIATLLDRGFVFVTNAFRAGQGPAAESFHRNYTETVRARVMAHENADPLGDALVIAGRWMDRSAQGDGPWREMLWHHGMFRPLPNVRESRRSGRDFILTLS